MLLDLLLFLRCGATHLGLSWAIHVVDDITFRIDDDVEFIRFPAPIADIDAANEADMPIDDNEFLVVRVFVAVVLRRRGWLPL